MNDSAPHPTLIQWLIDGSDPRAGYCRICRTFAVPTFEGYWEVGVCDRPCYDEFMWRTALRVTRSPYRRPEVS